MDGNIPILNIEPLGKTWKTQDPFIFCAYHSDKYPGGTKELGPFESLEGRNIGQDFSGKEGWSMYHGTKVPGFPAHPHSGFETVTIVSKGLVDHSDSLGAAGRFGEGDVQWLTSGRGVQHAEMFPLLSEASNPLEIFQLWMNLPKKSKKVRPYYKMLWSEEIPGVIERDQAGNTSRFKVIAGSYQDKRALAPTPDSWASDPGNRVQIWTIKMDAHATFTLPAMEETLTRSLYFYKGDSFTIGKREIGEKHLIELDAKKEVQIRNGQAEAYFLFLQGKPMNEPLIQYGPFVANTREELQETILLYKQTEFGGWPWPSPDPVHDKSRGRFSRLPDGNEVKK